MIPILDTSALKLPAGFHEPGDARCMLTLTMMG